MPKISLIDKRAITNETLSRNVVDSAEFTPNLILEWPWSPVNLNEDSYWLTGDNFHSVQILALDIDGGLSLNDAIRKMALSGYKHIIGTTRNHQKEKKTNNGTVKPAEDRFRILLFFQDAITHPQVYKDNWKFYVDSLGLRGIADSTQDLARFFFPCDSIVSNMAGKDLNIISMSPTNKSLPVQAISLKNSDKGRLTRKTQDFLLQTDDNNNEWHKKFVRASLDLKGKGYSFEEARSMLEKASPEGALDITHDIPNLKDVYERRESFFNPMEKAGDGWDWPEVYEGGRTSGKPKAHSVRNMEYAIQKLFGTLYYDIRGATIVKQAPYGPPLTEPDITSLKYKLFEAAITKEPTWINVVLNHSAAQHAYDPFKKVFEGEVWDGKDHLQQLFKTLVFDSSTPDKDMHWYEQFFKRWIRAMAAKYYEPGSQNNVLVFTAKQGIGKSRWLARLASVWHDGFKEGQVDPTNKDHALAHLEKFMWHIAELDNTTNNRDVSALKDFLTRSTISERRPYARVAETGKSICSFCATVNSTDFLHDTSGNRRFLVLPIIGLEAAHTVNIGQVFAQVAAEYKVGEPWYFTQKEIQDSAYLADQYRYKEDFTERFEATVKPGNKPLTIHQIVNTLRMPMDNTSLILSRGYKITLSNTMLRLGFSFTLRGNVKHYLVDEEALLAAAGKKPKPDQTKTELKWNQ